MHSTGSKLITIYHNGILRMHVIFEEEKSMQQADKKQLRECKSAQARDRNGRMNTLHITGTQSIIHWVWRESEIKSIFL